MWERQRVEPIAVAGLCFLTLVLALLGLRPGKGVDWERVTLLPRIDNVLQLPQAADAACQHDGPVVLSLPRTNVRSETFVRGLEAGVRRIGACRSPDAAPVTVLVHLPKNQLFDVEQWRAKLEDNFFSHIRIVTAHESSRDALQLPCGIWWMANEDVAAAVQTPYVLVTTIGTAGFGHVPVSTVEKAGVVALPGWTLLDDDMDVSRGALPSNKHTLRSLAREGRIALDAPSLPLVGSPANWLRSDVGQNVHSGSSLDRKIVRHPHLLFTRHVFRRTIFSVHKTGATICPFMPGSAVALDAFAIDVTASNFAIASAVTMDDDVDILAQLAVRWRGPIHVAVAEADRPMSGRLNALARELPNIRPVVVSDAPAFAAHTDLLLAARADVVADYVLMLPAPSVVPDFGLLEYLESTAVTLMRRNRDAVVLPCFAHDTKSAPGAPAQPLAESVEELDRNGVPAECDASNGVVDYARWRAWRSNEWMTPDASFLPDAPSTSLAVIESRYCAPMPNKDLLFRVRELQQARFLTHVLPRHFVVGQPASDVLRTPASVATGDKAAPGAIVSLEPLCPTESVADELQAEWQARRAAATMASAAGVVLAPVPAWAMLFFFLFLVLLPRVMAELVTLLSPAEDEGASNENRV